MFRDIEIQNAEQLMNPLWIDVRSPDEFREATIPGAINVPLFDDEERAQIGTVYKQESQEAAKLLGLEIASKKLPALVRTIGSMQENGRDTIVFCWRGGMRSKTVATIMDLMDVSVYRLTGGYRAFRNHIAESLLTYERDEPVPRCVVLHGMTGVGKTMLLQQMHEEGWPVLDLEKLAGHKGSVFGAIGETDVRNQRMFEALLYEELKRLKGQPYMIIEAESKRIGRVMLPEFLVEAKALGLHIYLEAPLSIRVQRTLMQYPVNIDDMDDKVSFALKRIEKRVSPDLRHAWWCALQEQRYEDLIESLLRDYYDSRYQHAFEQYTGTIHYVDATDLEECKQSIREIIVATPASTIPNR
ncbi:tRNA 2-selenouridine(34) synthase MnmH [Fodinisporobacter ferrooxydans]|uniref:tRNA 2-selenouridine(34) synthase MnmH n=1 Tax=Fodinisporobacter ferrooxydans TaxID=2901836 RepID=A0ABY4CNV2_9BACL|nr:tRNA 2-selenouridine(34) synthase MnmH [Alicyclobacillaceae bacterium MYW30-H2]